MSALIDALSHLGAHQRLFVACSGGRDSLSLAYACYLAHQQGTLPALPVLLHVHHGMQSANDDWANLVKYWANTYGFICHILPVLLDKKTETHARTARYQAMMDMMTDGDILLLAHHEGDQAETILMRLISGAGVQGLSGIKTWQTKTLNQKTIHLHRPWLNFTRQAITDFAHAHALPYVDDPTNDTKDNARSFIRNDILPKLRQLNPKAQTNIAKSASLIAQAHAIISPIIKEALSTCQNPSQSELPYQSVLSIRSLMHFDLPHQRAILHAWLGMNEAHAPPSHLIDEIVALTVRQNDQRTQIFWQGERGYVVCRYRDDLYRFWDWAWAYLHGQDKDNPLTLATPSDARPLQPCDKVPVVIHGVVRHLSGKKLYQTLGVAPFFRKHLYLIQNTDGTWVVAPYQSWQLAGDPCHLNGVRWQMR